MYFIIRRKKDRETLFLYFCSNLKFTRKVLVFALSYLFSYNCIRIRSNYIPTLLTKFEKTIAETKKIFEVDRRIFVVSQILRNFGSFYDCWMTMCMSEERLSCKNLRYLILLYGHNSFEHAKKKRIHILQKKSIHILQKYNVDFD